MKSPYGKKGGTSVNAGKQASTYSVRLPNGIWVKKRSFAVHAPTAIAACYEFKCDSEFRCRECATHGGWHVVGIYSTVQDVERVNPAYLALFAERETGPDVE